MIDQSIDAISSGVVSKPIRTNEQMNERTNGERDMWFIVKWIWWQQQIDNNGSGGDESKRWLIIMNAKIYIDDDIVMTV